MVAEVPDAGHLPTKSVKITFKKKILSNAYETIVANGNHNYTLDPIHKVYQGQKHLLMCHWSRDLLILPWTKVCYYP